MTRTISHEDMGLLDALFNATAEKKCYIVKAKDKWLSDNSQFDCGKRGHVQLIACHTVEQAVKLASEMKGSNRYQYVSWQWAGGLADAKVLARKLEGYSWTLRTWPFGKEEER